MSLKRGQRLNGRYIIETTLSDERSQFSITYLAKDEQSEQLVVIKTPKPGIKLKSRFLDREVAILKKISNENEHIVSFLDDFIVNNEPYLVMKYIEGITLENYVQQTQHLLPENEALEYISQIGEALKKLHNKEPCVVHRDVKPSNIMLQQQQTLPLENTQLKYKAILIDFGIAGQIDLIGNNATISGSRNYAPYEQTHGVDCPYRETYIDRCLFNNNIHQNDLNIYKCFKEPKLTKCRIATHLQPTLDIYALAATLYYVLTRREPLDSGSRRENDTLSREILREIFAYSFDNSDTVKARLYMAIYRFA